jgi:hypothetical protein
MSNKQGKTDWELSNNFKNWQRLVDCLRGPPSKGWIAQMEEHWYVNPEVSGSSSGPVKISLPIFQTV